MLIYVGPSLEDLWAFRYRRLSSGHPFLSNKEGFSPTFYLNKMTNKELKDIMEMEKFLGQSNLFEAYIDEPFKVKLLS